jgi:ABC-type uncharacterized transport system ATPase subunit
LLRCVGISKRFGGVRALDQVNFEAAPGEIHAIIGENGAGKSTLVNILAGRIVADSGTIQLDNKPIEVNKGHAGIAAVFQSPMLFERMTWEENLALGLPREISIDLKSIAEQAARRAAQLGIALPPRGTIITECSIGVRVRIEILRALSVSARVLILDEPTSVLAPAELDTFLDLVRRLRAEGRIVILVTHKLAEARAVADRITILRRGRRVAQRQVANTTESELARLMIGGVVEGSQSREHPDYSLAAPAALEIDRIVYTRHTGRVLDSVSIRVRGGEIVGVAGVEGNGQLELIGILAGMLTPDSGRIDTKGNRIAIIPQDRDRDGLILDLTLWENLMLSEAIRESCVGPLGRLDRGRAIRLCSKLLDDYGIRAAGPLATADTLSGGNRQRLMMARALSGNARIIVVHDPCRGLDLRGAAEVRKRLRQHTEADGAVLLISSDLDEIISLSDRMYVIARGRALELGAEQRDPTMIGMLMSGAT